MLTLADGDSRCGPVATRQRPSSLRFHADLLPPATRNMRKLARPGGFEPLARKRTETDFYAGGLQNDEGSRREWCERVGLGFSHDGLQGLQNIAQNDSVKAA